MRLYGARPKFNESDYV